MDCAEARAGLWPPERPRLAGREVVEARLHVASCPECRRFFEQDRVILDAMDRLREDRAPRELRERIFDAMARERTLLHSQGAGGRGPGLGSPGKRWTAAAVLILALGAAVALLRSGGGPGVERSVSAEAPGEAPDPAGAVFVEDYLRRAVGQDHITTRDPREAARFLARRLGVRMTPLQVAGLELEGAEICLLEGRLGAMVQYKLNGRPVSHYLVPRPEATPRAPAVMERDVGMPVVTWSTAAVEQALVGEASAEELLRLARRGQTGAS